MNNRIKELLRKAGGLHFGDDGEELTPALVGESVAYFTKLLVEEVLDQVKERAYYTGDRDWSDEVDRPWIQLEFGYGDLHDAKHHQGKWVKK